MSRSLALRRPEPWQVQLQQLTSRLLAQSFQPEAQRDPIPPEDFSALVASIYDCALDPSLWPDVLTALCRELDFRMSSLILAAMPGPRSLLDVTTGVTAEERGRMLAHSDAAVEAWVHSDRSQPRLRHSTRGVRSLNLFTSGSKVNRFTVALLLLRPVDNGD